MHILTHKYFHTTLLDFYIYIKIYYYSLFNSLRENVNKTNITSKLKDTRVNEKLLLITHLKTAKLKKK